MYSKKKYKKKTSKNRKIIIGVLIVLAVILGITANIITTDRKLTIFEKGIKDTVLSIKKVVGYPFVYIKNQISTSNEKKDLYNKYKKLEEQIDKVNTYEANIKELQNQLDELKGLLDIQKTLTDFESLNATVVLRDINYFNNTITVDKGEYHGITKNLAVITNKGLIGKVISTTTFTSTIKLITADNYNDKISVKIQANDAEIYGILTGYNSKNKTFVVEGISENNVIQPGQSVTTTGLSDVFPSGIFIGKVKSMTTDAFDLAPILEIESDIDFNDINFVTILKREVIN